MISPDSWDACSLEFVVVASFFFFPFLSFYV
jgi:hypothetical protein